MRSNQKKRLQLNALDNFSKARWTYCLSLLQQALEVEGDAEPEDAGVDLRAGQASLRKKAITMKAMNL